MIRIIEGGFYSGLHGMLRDEIKSHVEAGKRVYLIVPEQQAVVAECEFADLLPDAAPLFFEVTNFTRLANTVFRGLGGADAEYCDNEKKALIMWRGLTELSATLSITGGRREVNAGTVDRALAAVKEMQSLGIEAGELEGEKLENYLKKLFTPHLGEKIDAVVLGCTHYPHIKAEIAKQLPKGVVILDGSKGTARETARRLRSAGLLRERGEGRVEIENSLGDEKLLALSWQLLTRE